MGKLRFVDMTPEQRTYALMLTKHNSPSGRDYFGLLAWLLTAVITYAFTR